MQKLIKTLFKGFLLIFIPIVLAVGWILYEIFGWFY